MSSAFLVCLVAGCDTLLPPPTPSPSPLISGIAGVILLGPTCEHPTAREPCLEPYAAKLVVFDTNGQVVTQVTSASDGRFQVTLPVGDYVLQPAPGGDPFPRAEAQSVSVLPGEMTQVEIDYEARDRTDQAGGSQR